MKNRKKAKSSLPLFNSRPRNGELSYKTPKQLYDKDMVLCGLCGHLLTIDDTDCNKCLTAVEIIIASNFNNE